MHFAQWGLFIATSCSDSIVLCGVYKFLTDLLRSGRRGDRGVTASDSTSVVLGDDDAGEPHVTSRTRTGDVGSTMQCAALCH